MWCMRFEAKHNFFKRQQKCFKNITLRLARKHQHHMSYNWEYFSQNKMIFGPGKEISLSDFTAGKEIALKLNVLLNTRVLSVKWVKHHGDEYRPDLVVCTDVVQEMPVFKKIDCIIVKDQQVFLVVAVLETLCFNEHFHAFQVAFLKKEFSVIDVKELVYHRPFDLQMTYKMDDYSQFVVPYCHFL
ncbi:hypothetical protein MHYP_G00226010 [Metynnis hypsauchen]